jgi:predicted transcriptional regulator
MRRHFDFSDLGSGKMDNRVCRICDGGPGNECACTCPNGPQYGVYFREENARWSGDDVLAISVIEFYIVKRTSKGVWIAPTWDAEGRFKKFVLEGRGKRFAYPTRQEARESFIRRKKREIQRTAAQHDRAVRYLKLAETGRFGTQTEALHEIKTRETLLPEPAL